MKVSGVPSVGERGSDGRAPPTPWFRGFKNRVTGDMEDYSLDRAIELRDQAVQTAERRTAERDVALRERDAAARAFARAQAEIDLLKKNLSTATNWLIRLRADETLPDTRRIEAFEALAERDKSPPGITVVQPSSPLSGGELHLQLSKGDVFVSREFLQHLLSFFGEQD